MTLRIRPLHYLAPALALLATAPAPAAAQGYEGYPYSITTPEGGSATRHRATRAMPHRNAKTPHEPAASVSGRYSRRTLAVRGSSGSVLPTPLPRTEPIPPEGGGVPSVRPLPQEQAPTIVPGLSRPIPNLPHGAETFQDRASRCAFQQGLYGVPGTASNRYMGACLQ
jgi:hypothetical protein